MNSAALVVELVELTPSGLEEGAALCVSFWGITLVTCIVTVGLTSVSVTPTVTVFSSNGCVCPVAVLSPVLILSTVATTSPETVLSTVAIISPEAVPSSVAVSSPVDVVATTAVFSPTACLPLGLEATTNC